MNVIDVSNEIQERIKALSTYRDQLKELSKNKAECSADYERALARCIVELRSGKEMQIDTVIVKDPPATVLEKVAKGIVWQVGMNRDVAEARYKNAIANIEAVKAELNGWQSIYRHLDST